MPRLPPPLTALLEPGAYAHPVGEVQLVETHVSWVVLTGEYAYKIKRPVQYPFIDLRAPERREFLCREELRLNRRFAPELYLEVCPITLHHGRVRMGGDGEPIEHAVRMRQFSRDQELSALLESGRVEPSELAAFGRELARVHESLPEVPRPEAFGTADYVSAQLRENVRQCLLVSERMGVAKRVDDMKARYLARLESSASVIAARRERGRVRECHGDLHSRNVVRHDGRLLAFDCMEFEAAFRCIDVAEDIAFLMMDLLTRDAPRHAVAFLNGYFAEGGDYHAARLLSLYGAHRALVRAKVAALEAGSASDGEDARRMSALDQHRAYVECAQRLIAPGHPKLILMSGLSGSGKTWLAERLAPKLGALHIRSDVERKRLAGLSERDRSGSSVAGGLYTSDMSARVYERLTECAEDGLAGGFPAIVDATFRSRADRAGFVAMARRLSIPVVLVECTAPAGVLERRIVGRAQAGRDASEADLRVLAWQRERFEPVSADEGFATLNADTTRPNVVDEVSSAIRGSA